MTGMAADVFDRAIELDDARAGKLRPGRAHAQVQAGTQILTRNRRALFEQLKKICADEHAPRYPVDELDQKLHVACRTCMAQGFQMEVLGPEPMAGEQMKLAQLGLLERLQALVEEACEQSVEAVPGLRIGGVYRQEEQILGFELGQVLRRARVAGQQF